MHDWTCAVEQGIAPTPKQLHGGAEGFFDYAKMYCRECGGVYRKSAMEEYGRN